MLVGLVLFFGQAKVYAVDIFTLAVVGGAAVHLLQEHKSYYRSSHLKDESVESPVKLEAVEVDPIKVKDNLIKIEIINKIKIAERKRYFVNPNFAYRNHGRICGVDGICIR